MPSLHEGSHHSPLKGGGKDDYVQSLEGGGGEEAYVQSLEVILYREHLSRYVNCNL